MSLSVGCAEWRHMAIIQKLVEFSTTLWVWYGPDEYKRVLAVCEAIAGLTFLAMNADAQRDAIPYVERLRNCAGLTPRRCLKAVVMCAWELKPQVSAISDRLAVESRIDARALARRRSIR